MRKEIATLWVAALRSGKYAQTTGSLEITAEYAEKQIYDGEGFCCLGVLSALACDAGIVSRNVDEYGVIGYGTEGNWSTSNLPDMVAEWAGMMSVMGIRDNADYHVGDSTEYRFSLMRLNDIARCTFEQIADVIEAEYETL